MVRALLSELEFDPVQLNGKDAVATCLYDTPSSWKAPVRLWLV